MSFLTQHRDAADLLLHLGRVDLAHVAAGVVELYLQDLQCPRAVLVVSDAHARVVRDHALVKGQHGLVAGLDPTNLGIKQDKGTCIKP